MDDITKIIISYTMYNCYIDAKKKYSKYVMCPNLFYYKGLYVCKKWNNCIKDINNYYWFFENINDIYALLTFTNNVIRNDVIVKILPMYLHQTYRLIMDSSTKYFIRIFCRLYDPYRWLYMRKINLEDINLYYSESNSNYFSSSEIYKCCKILIKCQSKYAFRYIIDAYSFDLYDIIELLNLMVDFSWKYDISDGIEYILQYIINITDRTSLGYLPLDIEIFGFILRENVSINILFNFFDFLNSERKNLYFNYDLKHLYSKLNGIPYHYKSKLYLYMVKLYDKEKDDTPS